MLSFPEFSLRKTWANVVRMCGRSWKIMLRSPVVRHVSHVCLYRFATSFLAQSSQQKDLACFCPFWSFPSQSWWTSVEWRGSRKRIWFQFDPNHRIWKVFILKMNDFSSNMNDLIFRAQNVPKHWCPRHQAKSASNTEIRGSLGYFCVAVQQDPFLQGQPHRRGFFFPAQNHRSAFFDENKVLRQGTDK